MSATILPVKKNHYPVLLQEVISIISPQNGGTFIDCTFGQGSYSEKILEFSNTKVIAFDRDVAAIPFSNYLKKKFSKRFTFYNKKFSHLNELGAKDEIMGIVFDLGFSQGQINDKTRGFSFKSQSALDMKMGLNDFSASDAVQNLSQISLEKIFKYFGEEKKSKIISKEIVKERIIKTLDTQDLVRIINKHIKNKRNKRDPSTKIFQALRMFVNQEISELINGLKNSCDLISRNGIIATVSFHSIEDKICKHTFNSLSKKNDISRYLPEVNKQIKTFELVTKKAIKPSLNEISKNPASRSAKLRAIKKINNQEFTKINFDKFNYLKDIDNLKNKL